VCRAARPSRAIADSNWRVRIRTSGTRSSARCATISSLSSGTRSSLLCSVQALPAGSTANVRMGGVVRACPSSRMPSALIWMSESPPVTTLAGEPGTGTNHTSM
jgi:hypothetical protein